MAHRSEECDGHDQGTPTTTERLQDEPIEAIVALPFVDMFDLIENC